MLVVFASDGGGMKLVLMRLLIVGVIMKTVYPGEVAFRE